MSIFYYLFVAVIPFAFAFGRKKVLKEMADKSRQIKELDSTG